MSADRLYRMVTRRVMRGLVNRGVDAGVTHLTRGEGKADDLEQRARGRKTAQRAKSAIKLGRRLGKF